MVESSRQAGISWYLRNNYSPKRRWNPSNDWRWMLGKWKEGHWCPHRLCTL